VSAKVKAPTEPEITKVYEANQSVLGGRPLSEVRDRIVSFLRTEPEQKVFIAFVRSLKTKYRVVAGKKVNAPKLLPTDVLATVGGKPITVQAFELKNRAAIYETKARVFDQLRYDLDRLILSALVSLEAKTLGIEPSQMLASEITDKLREFTDEERFALETTLRRRLSAKFKPQYMYSEPTPPVYLISTDGEPQRGAPNAPVTVIMFSDFQCSACSATHPILQDVLAEYGSQIRFVVRDFPLQTLHPNAYNAALAANAAAAQGKFFEYTDLLYRNQDALDAESLRRYAGAVGLNPQKFELDFQGEKVASDVKKDIADGKLLGISGTPTIYVNGVRVRYLNADAFRDAIERALRK
jgi:protein-disulfide isomerase